MKEHIKILVELLTKSDLEGLLQHYLASNESENVTQLAFMFQQGQKQLSHYEFLQELTAKFIESKGLPLAVIERICTSDTLSFFTPALQLAENFIKKDEQQRNVLHCLFIGKKLLGIKATTNKNIETNQPPPFNYVRSMMLFGSNETLRSALCERDKNALTPIEVYLADNQNITALLVHELTALLALIEIENKQQVLVAENYGLVIQNFSQLCHQQEQIITDDLQRILLIATYFKKSVEQVITDLQRIN